jgi:hypothetical protein
MKQLRSIGKWGSSMGNNNGVTQVPFAGWWVLGLIILLIAGASCTPEDEILTREESVQLLFDQDTVQFDTVFTTVGSTTQWLQVYNPQPKAVNIGVVSLADPENSPFRLLLNGEAGTQFNNVRLRGGDSLLLLVEVTVDPTNTDLPFIVKDSIRFSTNGNVQYVNLEAWGQDAYFLKSEIITQDSTFSGERPYVVRDSLRVAPGVILTLAAGAQLYFNDGAGLLVDGTLQATGTPDARVVLRHMRGDGAYRTAPGQWQGVFFGSTSEDNALDFAVIRNAAIGATIVAADNDTVPDLRLSNTIIENASGFGVLAVEADVDLSNTLISDCASGSFLGLGRAYYRFRHCTLVNEPSSLAREDNEPLLGFDQNFRGSDQLTQSFSLNVINCIVWGALENELLFAPFELENPVNLRLSKTIIKSTDTTPSLVETNFYNQPPLFVSPSGSNYHLDSLSPAINAGFPLGIERDLDGDPRDAQPDLGAYEYAPE